MPSQQASRKDLDIMKNIRPKQPLLLTPGPVPVPPAVLKKLSEPMIHHRTPEVKKLLLQTQTLLKKFFQTKNPVLILNANGTGAMAASLVNTLSPGDSVLVLCAGRFAQRWVDMAKAYRLKVFTVEAPWGKVIPLKEVKARLKQHPKIKAVLAQACETSTGVLHPVKEVAQLIKNQPHRIFILDAISALGAALLPMDRWGIDVLMGGSQKSFSLPAGMSFISLSKKAWRFNQKSKMPVFYLDLKKELKAQALGQTAYSTNVSFLKALYTALSPLKNKGLSYFTNRSRSLSRITLRFARHTGLKVFSEVPSPSVTALELPAHIDGVELKQKLQSRYKVTLGGGMEKMQGRLIRIGHLGHVSKKDLFYALRALALTLYSLDPQTFPMQKIRFALGKAFS